MNVKKTNLAGLAFINEVRLPDSSIKELLKNSALSKNSAEKIIFHKGLAKPNKKAPIIRVSKKIVEACQLIDIDSIKRSHFDESLFDFNALRILLDNDKSGAIRVERLGSDYHFLFIKNISTKSSEIDICINTFSFLSKEFQKDDSDHKESVFVIQLLTYLKYGDIDERTIGPKGRARVAGLGVLNNSKNNITFCDTLWKQRINFEGFKVSGHFRLQRFGKENKKRKLIWIETYEKKGYKRRATVEKFTKK